MKKDWNFWKGYVKYFSQCVWLVIRPILIGVLGLSIAALALISFIVFPLTTSIFISVIGLSAISLKTYIDYLDYVKYLEKCKNEEEQLRKSKLEAYLHKRKRS